MRLNFFMLSAMTAPTRRFQIVDIPGSTGMIFDGANVVYDLGRTKQAGPLARLTTVSVAHEYLTAESSPARCRIYFPSLCFGAHVPTLIE